MNDLAKKILDQLQQQLYWCLDAIRAIKANSMPSKTSQPSPIMPIGFPPKILAWAEAVEKAEGAPDSTNPGDLKYAPLTMSWGAVPGRKASDGGYLAHFPEGRPQGFNALCNFLILGCHDELKAYHAPEARTLGGFMKIYGGNPPQGYLDRIATDLNVSLDVNIGTFLL